MSRPNLERFIAAHGISYASILLGRGPHQLERWRDGQDDMPEAVAGWLELDNLNRCGLHGVAEGKRPMIETVVQLIRTTKLDLSSEKRAQADLEEAFTRAGIAFDREVPLTKSDVIDFMVDGLGIELKLRNTGKKDVYKQLRRYARHERVESLLLASNLSMGLPPVIEGKNAYFVKLGEAWL